MQKIVWISAYLPYDSVNHAGGRIHNYYLNRLIETHEFDIRLISFYTPDEINKFTIGGKIQCDLICYETGLKKLVRGIREINYKHNPFHKYGNIANRFSHYHILKILKRYRDEGYTPDIIILEWTQIVVFIKDIKAVFPDAKFVSIEEDVALLSYKRKKEKEKRLLKKWIAGLRFKKLENAEVDALASSDLIILNNEKDSKLLEQYNILKGKKIKVWAPYYDSYVKYKRGEIYEHSMIYYGAMNRPENYLSVIWFIDKVLPLFDQEFEYKFYVVGGKPDRRLLSYESDKIVITGFVEDVSEYFSKVGCLVAPLVLGAGIKIKILEALSAGIPVLTNSIGIEGIPAEPNKEYFHCEMPEDYSGVIQKLFRGEYDNRQIEDDEKKFVSTHFNYEKSADDFIKWIRSICLYE